MDERGVSPRAAAGSPVDPATRWVRLAGHVLWTAGAVALVVAVGSFVRAHAWLWSAAAMKEHVGPGRAFGSLPNPFHQFDDEHQWFIIGLCAVPILAGYAILSFTPRVGSRPTRR